MPVIALLTDFGLRDHYVGAMKGVMLGICPGATLVDITHDIAPQDVRSGALELAACHRSFPDGTVFLAVVDPGVGSARRAIAAEAGPHRFVAPDNGLLSAVLAERAPSRVVTLTSAQYAAPVVSRTFEGRDRFAPAAAWLAGGLALDALGPPVDDWTRLVFPAAVVRGGSIEGEVARVDRFGNLVTNVPGAMVAGARPWCVQVGSGPPAPLVATYADVPAGQACALVGSTGHVEVSVNAGSAAERFGAGRGSRVVVVECGQASHEATR
jgi:S-adenosyl-L-methionine hydrolase (adenosine-forming)